MDYTKSLLFEKSLGSISEDFLNLNNTYLNVKRVCFKFIIHLIVNLTSNIVLIKILNNN